MQPQISMYWPKAKYKTYIKFYGVRLDGSKGILTFRCAGFRGASASVQRFISRGAIKPGQKVWFHVVFRSGGKTAYNAELQY